MNECIPLDELDAFFRSYGVDLYVVAYEDADNYHYTAGTTGFKKTLKLLHSVHRVYLDE